ncbi:MAG: hypothetical protein ACRECY_00605 [Phyllobacterium sp.]
MPIAIVAIDGVQIDAAEEQRPLLTIIRRHRIALKEHEWLVERCDDARLAGEECARLEQRQLAAEIAEQQARADFFSHPVETIEDVAAKAGHVRSFLYEEELDKSEIDMLMRSLESPIVRARREAPDSESA